MGVAKAFLERATEGEGVGWGFTEAAHEKMVGGSRNAVGSYTWQWFSCFYGAVAPSTAWENVLSTTPLPLQPAQTTSLIHNWERTNMAVRRG